MSAHGTTDEVRTVTPEQWLDALGVARDQGHDFFDFLDAVDEVGRADEVRIVARLYDWQGAHGVQLHVRLDRDRPELPSARALFAGAVWHEREVHDFFGVDFTGGDSAPLLNHDPSTRWLRKDVVLAARAAQAWPGGKEPGEGPGAARRRMAPPGVPDPAVWGDRDPSLPAASADEVAASVGGGRVRRRR